jgi:hypothetical protein
MADPTITSATLNKGAYAPGETMILTVVGEDLDEQTVEVTVKIRNRESGAESSAITVQATVDEVEVVATGDRTFTQTGRTGNTFTLTATA